MPSPEELDRVLRDALGAVPDTGEPSRAARGRLVAELRRRRARRARAIGAGVAGALVVAGLAVTLGTTLTAPGAPARSATPGPAHGVEKRSASGSSLSAPPAFATPQSAAADGLPAAPCGELRVGSGPATCTGASARPVTMRVGQRVSLKLSGNRAVRWSAPGTAPGDAFALKGEASAGAATPGRAAPAPSGAVLAPVPGTTHVKGGSASASFVATHPGDVLLYADAAVGCGTKTGPSIGCRPGTRRWSVVVIVKNG
ncbi:MAG TPA: hypothetical protein VMU76_05540 [Acidimicrobiales bacterium]|nr:hypothetical protein [Acidimicrobiales bacterium]